MEESSDVVREEQDLQSIDEGITIQVQETPYFDHNLRCVEHGRRATDFAESVKLKEHAKGLYQVSAKVEEVKWTLDRAVEVTES